jgi:hypothetical protein
LLERQTRAALAATLNPAGIEPQGRLVRRRLSSLVAGV